LIRGQVPSERSFGLSVGLACAAVGGLAWWNDHGLAATILIGLGALLVTGGLVAPTALRVPNQIWWRVAQTLGWVNARILLTVFFIVVLTPVGRAMRLFGWDPLRRRRRAASNWSPYPERRRHTNHYEHLF
jgi:hypothetical protein